MPCTVRPGEAFASPAAAIDQQRPASPLIRDADSKRKPAVTMSLAAVWASPSVACTCSYRARVALQPVSPATAQPAMVIHTD